MGEYRRDYKKGLTHQLEDQPHDLSSPVQPEDSRSLFLGKTYTSGHW